MSKEERKGGIKMSVPFFHEGSSQIGEKNYIYLPRVPSGNLGWCQLLEVGQTRVGMLRHPGMASKSGRLG